MGLHQNCARIRPSDIDALTRAEISLVEAGATISGAGPKWAPAVLELINQATETIRAIRDRGLARIQRYLAKREDRAGELARGDETQAKIETVKATAPAGWPGGKGS